jgi:hypothetical protein
MAAFGLATQDFDESPEEQENTENIFDILVEQFETWNNISTYICAVMDFMTFKPSRSLKRIPSSIIFNP